MERWEDNIEEIKAFLNSSVDTSQLDEMRKASSLIEAPNVDRKPDIDTLKKRFNKQQDTKGVT